MAFLESQGNQFFWVVGSTGGISSGNASASTSGDTVGGVAVGQIVAYNGPSGSAGKIDVTNLGSTAKQFLMGLRDEGDISLDVVYDPSTVVGHEQLFADRGTRTQRAWLLKLATGATAMRIGGKAYCTGFSVTGAVDDAVKATMTLAITGAVNVSSVTTLAILPVT